MKRLILIALTSMFLYGCFEPDYDELLDYRDTHMAEIQKSLCRMMGGCK